MILRIEENARIAAEAAEAARIRLEEEERLRLEEEKRRLEEEEKQR